MINVFLCIGLGPYFFSASICAAEPYPLLEANPYSGRTLSYSSIIRSRRLSRLSIKMLELTGLYEASEDSFNPAEIQVDNFLKEVKELIDCRLQEKNISLDVFCEPKELVKKFDQDLMISVVTNLIDNAVKASRKESKIVLEATPDHLMVQDFGKGIPKEDLEMVTEPFYMVDKSRSRAKGSVGLGLSLCQKIIELHDFQLKIESNPGKGTTVSVFW